MIKRTKKKTKKRVKSPPSISKLIKKADQLFSLQVRQRGASPDGYNVCYTCGHVSLWKKLHCSHYLSRYYKAARWNPDNCRPACYVCNIWKKGDLVRFRQNLIAEIGEARVLAVEKLRDAPVKLSREFLEELIQSLQVEI